MMDVRLALPILLVYVVVALCLIHVINKRSTGGHTDR
jgi:hypothetical protein